MSDGEWDVKDNYIQQGERVRRGNLDNTSDEVIRHTSQSTSNKRDMGNPADAPKGCGKGDCGKLEGYYPNGDTWYCDDCETSHKEANGDEDG